MNVKLPYFGSFSECMIIGEKTQAHLILKFELFFFCLDV